MQKICQIIMFLLFTWGMGNGISAVEVTWNNSSGVDNLWSNANNWSSGQVPTTGDTVIINNGGTVDLGLPTLKMQGDIQLSSGSIVANAPEIEYCNNFFIMENSFTMTGGTVDINARRFLLGTEGTSVSTISGGKLTYRHDGGYADGSMRVGSLWGGAASTDGDVVDATLNIQNNAELNAARMVLGFGGWNYHVQVKGTVVVEGTAKLILGADAIQGETINNEKPLTEYALVVGHLSNGTGNIVVKDSGVLTTQGRISIAQQQAAATFTLQDSGTVESVEMWMGRKGRWEQTGGTASFEKNFVVNSVGNFAGEHGMVVSDGNLTVNGTLFVGNSGGANASAYVAGGTFKATNLTIAGNSNFKELDGKSILTINGAKSQWTVGTFLMSGVSELLFEFGSGGYATIATTNSTLSGNAKVSATFDIDRIQIVQDRYELITATNKMNNSATLYHNTDYWKIFQDGKNIVLDLEKFYEGIPDFPVSEGVVQLTTPGDTIEFYTDIFNPQEMQEFLDWLKEAEDVFSAKNGDDGSVIVKFAKELDHFAFDFNMFGRPVHISSNIIPIPEPATWGMFLMGLAGIYFLRKRRLRKNA
ncbi:MAG: PEP-CTERM sorting domain-containing protein [Planctomycetia bacterium]|nr:PEP-CTERM sorting domain-containing protein [Planctomycetia bacterium]